eukprot:961712-Rhodomonas_salina.1
MATDKAAAPPILLRDLLDARDRQRVVLVLFNQLLQLPCLLLERRLVPPAPRQDLPGTCRVPNDTGV